MYVREEDVFNAIYHQLKLYIGEHFISSVQYKQQIRQFDDQITEAAQHTEEAWTNAIRHYEQFVEGKIDRAEFRSAQDYANETKAVLDEPAVSKTAYEEQYQVFRKLLRASTKEIPLSKIMDIIHLITVNTNKRIIINFGKPIRGEAH